MTEQNFIPDNYTKAQIESIKEGKQGKTTWRSPSNIALVKYWGKRENQIPANPSISFTLSDCVTTTSVSFTKLKNKAKTFSFDVIFEGSPRPDFRPKIESFLSRVEIYLPFLKWYELRIETSNSFPHSSGIASSASGMSALALCLLDIERDIAPIADDGFFLRKASFLARLGSGSACRSVEGSLVHWGAHETTEGSSDLYGIAYPYDKDAIFEDYQDTILLVDKGQKEVSSTVGHNLMHGHPFAQKRFAQAHNNLYRLQQVFAEGDLDEFVKTVESEALTLHAMMMTSNPYFILMKPNTLEIINKIWAFRKATKSHVCFTLDAGANVHVLYPNRERQQVLEFIENELVVHCEKGHYICDRIGYGAEKM